MIGFYNYSVILTYLSLVSAVVGITLAVGGNILSAILCLLVSGFCDSFDGRVARSMKNRTVDEENFGMEIDSLCDLVAFTALPAVIAYCLGGVKPLAIFSGALLVLCGVIRLAYFNVLEIKRKREDPDAEHIYRGLPVTSTSLIVPIAYLFHDIFGANYATFFHIVLIITSILFVLDFKIRKPGLRGVLIMIATGFAAGAIAILLNL